MSSSKNKLYKHLRAARRIDDVLFDDAIRSYLEKGQEALQGNSKVGAPKRIEDAILALLLADVESRPKGMTEDKKLRELARMGVRWGNSKGYRSKWLNQNTIKTHLQTARDKRKADPAGFGDLVDFYSWALPALDNLTNKS